MRPVTLGGGFGQGTLEDRVRKIEQALAEIERASQSYTPRIADSYTISNSTATLRTLNVSGATLLQVAQVLATYLTDVHNRGVTNTI